MPQNIEQLLQDLISGGIVSDRSSELSRRGDILPKTIGDYARYRSQETGTGDIARIPLVKREDMKSIDDIIMQADIVEALTPKDATNVDVSSQQIKPEQDPRYGIPQDPIQQLFDMQDNIGRGETMDLLNMILRSEGRPVEKSL